MMAQGIHPHLQLTLLDFEGGLVEAPVMFRAGSPFRAHFRRTTAADTWKERPFAILIVMPSNLDAWPRMSFLIQQFPSLTPFGPSDGVWAMSEADYAKMRLIFGGQGWT